MAINPEDVKLYESQVLNDEDDGGGRATGNEIVDNVVNNLFPDISRLDRTLGDVALRKAFLGIDTDNQDVYLGAHAIIVEPPADPNVHALLFDAGSEDDTRLEARDRIEAYVVRGSRAQFELLGNQYENQRQLACIQLPDRSIPSAGDVFLLRLADESNEQYVRITEVEHEILSFTYQTSPTTFVTFDARRLTLGISAPLITTFYGGEPAPQGTTAQASTGQDKSEVFTTEVADAARYWGVSMSTEDVEVGDLSVTVESIYSNLVPSAQSEQGLADQALAGDLRTVRPATAGTFSTSVTAQWVSPTLLQFFLPRACVRGSCALTMGGSNYQDNSDGTLSRVSGNFPVSTFEIDYAQGTITGERDSGTGTGTQSGSVTFQPGLAFLGKPASTSQGVTLNNRGFNWNFQTPDGGAPLPGTTVVSYMALGEWYELRDNGTGQLEGVGTGTINFATGTISITTEALPDVGTQIIVSFVHNIADEYETHEGTYAGLIPEVEFQLGEGVDPGSLTIDFTSGGQTRTLTDQGDGTLTGYGTGTINYGTGDVRITPQALHDDGTSFDASYSVITTPLQMDAGPVADYRVQGTIPGAPLKPGSLAMTLNVRRWRNKVNGPGIEQVTEALRFRDDGSGGWTQGITGEVNYTTGAYIAIVETPYALSYKRPLYEYEIQS